MRSILIANPKGGAGKTTLATNLAGHFANAGKKVTLFDLDRQQSALRWLAFRDPAAAPIAGHFAGNSAFLSVPTGVDWTVLDGPAGLQGYKLSEYVRQVDKVIVPVVPSVFDMAATEDFLNSMRTELASRRGVLGIVAMRVAPRTRAAQMLEEFLRHFDVPLLGYLRGTQNYVNVAASGLSIFDPPRSRYKRDADDWAQLLQWLKK